MATKEANRRYAKIGKEMGYLFSYFLFTTTLFFILKFSNKLPDNYPYIHAMWLTLVIVLTGLCVKKLLK